MGSGCSSLNAVKTSSTTAVSNTTNFKIVLFGESFSGKTSLLNRYIHNCFYEDYHPTKNLDIVNVVKKINIPDEQIVAIEIWDTPHANSEELKDYLTDANAAVVAVDILDDEALHYALKWKKVIDETEITSSKSNKNNALKKGNKSFPVLLLGTKIDMLRRVQELEKPKQSDGTVISTEHNDNDDALSTKDEKLIDDKKEEHEDLSTTNDIELKTSADDPDVPVNTEATSSKSDVDVVQEQDLSDKNNSVVETSEENNKNLSDEVDKKHVATEEELQSKSEVATDKAGENKKLDDNSSSNQSSDANSSKQTKEEDNSDQEEVVDKNTSQEEVLIHDSEKVKDLKDSNEDTQENKVITNETTTSESTNADKPQTSDQSDEIKNSENSDDHQPDPTKDDVTEEKKNSEASNQDNHELESTKSETDRESSSESKVNKTGNDVEEDRVETKGVLSTMSVFEEDKPLPLSSISKLKAFARENRFFSGNCVSSRNADGGVHEAFQSLIRHLVNDSYKASGMKHQAVSLSSVNSSKNKSQNYQTRDFFEPLQEIGIIEVDEVLQQCNKSLKEAENVINIFHDVLLHFKRACYEEGLVKKSNFEGCVASLKQAVEMTQKRENEMSEIRVALLLQEKQSYSLVATDQDEIFSVDVVDEDHNHIDIHRKNHSPFSKNLVVLLDLLNEKVLNSCGEILRRYDGIQQQLSNHHSVLADKEEKAWDVAVAAGRSQSGVRRILTGIAQSKARVKGTIDQLHDVHSSVNELLTKTKATLLF